MKSKYHYEIPAEDISLTHVERGSPMGEMLRRHWQPVCTSDEIGELPKRVRIMCEDLVVFRDGKVEETLEIHVKAGWKEGTKVTYAGRGDEVPGQPPQDLVFVLTQKPHPVFTREGDDLIVTKRISLVEALTEGNKIEVKSLDGRVLRVPLREVIRPGSERVIAGEGMPKPKYPGQKGNLRIKFDVSFPVHQLGGQAAEDLKRALGANGMG